MNNTSWDNELCGTCGCERKFHYTDWKKYNWKKPEGDYVYTPREYHNHCHKCGKCDHFVSVETSRSTAL